jgi:hypothetical protein
MWDSGLLKAHKPTNSYKKPLNNTIEVQLVYKKPIKPPNWKFYRSY